MADPYGWLTSSLATIHRANWYRSPTVIDGITGPIVALGSQELINFASNDYLGLATDGRLKQAATKAIAQLGTGATGSRLLTGHRQLHDQLEQAIAAWKQTETALVFSSGYTTNLGVIAALVGPKDLILADEYNHSSLKNGAKLSQAQILTYGHRDLGQLEHYLRSHRGDHRRCLIISDSVFSMDGDLCPLPQLLDLGDQYDAMVLLDEAHSTGVLGSRGSGGVEYFDCCHRPLIQIGTLSKALGSLGGYVAGSKPLIDFLRNRCPTWIYTTGLTPADTAAALEAIAIIERDPLLLRQLQRNITFFRSQVNLYPKLQQKLFPSASAIFCFAMDDPTQVLSIAQHLRDRGCFVSAIRPPTAPTSRLRVSLMATHSLEHINYLLEQLADLI